MQQHAVKEKGLLPFNGNDGHTLPCLTLPAIANSSADENFERRHANMAETLWFIAILLSVSWSPVCTDGWETEADSEKDIIISFFVLITISYQ